MNIYQLTQITRLNNLSTTCINYAVARKAFGYFMTSYNIVRPNQNNDGWTYSPNTSLNTSDISPTVAYALQHSTNGYMTLPPSRATRSSFFRLSTTGWLLRVLRSSLRFLICSSADAPSGAPIVRFEVADTGVGLPAGNNDWLYK